MEQQKSIDNLNTRIAAMKMTLLEMTMNLQQCEADIGTDSVFDDAEIVAAENKLMQIMMDLLVNTGNVETLTMSVDMLVVDTNTEQAAIDAL